MKKKLISILLCTSMAMGIAALADVDYIGGDLKGGYITIQSDEDIVVNGYTDGKLAFSKLYKSVDGKVTINEAEDKLLSYKPRRAIKLDSQEVVDLQIGTGTPAAPTATPTPTDEPMATPEPTETPAPTAVPGYNPNVFPDVYEKAVNALYAFSVIDKVSQEISDGQQGYSVTYYFQGNEYTDWFADDIELISPLADPDQLAVSDISSLKRGDVVYMNRRMNGSISSISLIFKAQTTDIINNTKDFGTSFENLFKASSDTNTSSTISAGGYSKWPVLKYGQQAPKSGTCFAFGMVANRDNTVLYLLNKTGDINNAIKLELAEDAIVYECDMEYTQGIEVTKIQSITSSIPNIIWNKALDGDGQVDLTEEGYNYALARVVDGTVMDIIVYTNY